MLSLKTFVAFALALTGAVVALPEPVPQFGQPCIAIEGALCLIGTDGPITNGPSCCASASDDCVLIVPIETIDGFSAGVSIPWFLSIVSLN